MILRQPADNFEFYSSPQGNEILNNKNFTPKIMNYLDEEHQAIQRILGTRTEKYDALLEIGCGHASNIKLSALLRLKYFGIDFIENVIKVARYQISKNKLSGQVDCLSVLNLDHTTTPVPQDMRTVCLFPFNVFGNIFEPIRILKIMKMLNYAMLISTYRNDMKLTPILNYYESCGLSHIKSIKSEKGTTLISNNKFKSIVYNSDYIHTLADQLSMTVESCEFGKIGKLYYITPHY